MGYTVLLPQDLPAEAKTQLLKIGCTVKMGRGFSEAGIIADIEDCEAVAARTARIGRKAIEAGKKLRIISRFGVGVDNIDLAAAEESGVWVANTPQANSVSVAEHAVALMLAAANDMVDSCTEVRKGNFAYRDQVSGIELHGKTLGIVGLGRIGRHVAAIAGMGLGMRVLAYDPFVAPGQLPEYVLVAGGWEQVFRESDFVSLHLPVTPQTRRSVGRKEFSVMRKSAWLINCARGELVAEDELIEALRSGEIAGAALDVLEKEPPVPDNPLFSLKNVLVTPHESAFTRESIFRMGEHMAQNIRDVMSGRKPSWPVNNPVPKNG
jgi:D-3-phosphoglycerate dehydrogenase